MLKRRIIACLDIKEGRTVKGINFENIRDAGDPIELSKIYIQQGVDELVFLDISATKEKRKTLTELVTKIAESINIPFTVGGGINTLDDARAVIQAGADKVSVNSAAVKRPELISEIAAEFGSQCLVVAVDTKRIDNQWWVFVNGGSKPTTLLTKDWCNQAVSNGAGEILLTSMNNDGTKSGFNLEITNEISSELPVPVIASGGAGKMEHFNELFKCTKATGGLAASIFHYNEISINELKQYLATQKIPVRK